MPLFRRLRAVIYRVVLKNPRLRLFLTKLIYGDDDVDVSILGTRLRINALKENGYFRASLMLEHSYSLALTTEIPVMMNLALLMADGDTFVDIGANVGLYSATLAKRNLLCGQKNQFYAFEPNADTVSRLRKNCEHLGVTIIPQGVSSKSETKVFVEGAVSNIFTSLDHATPMNFRSRKSEVECVALDDVSFPDAPVILKIDVEGQELEVLEGARKLFDTGRIKAVYIDGYNDAGVERFLGGYGFEFFEGVSLQQVQGGCFALLALQKQVALEFKQCREA